MRYIKEFLKWFVIINTGVVLVLFLNTMRVDVISCKVFWQIFASSALTALPTTVLYSIDPKKVMPLSLQILAVAIHYVVLLVIMVWLGVSFGWIIFNGHGIIIMALSVAAVYVCSFGLGYALNASEAKAINEALKNIRD